MNINNILLFYRLRYSEDFIRTFVEQCDCVENFAVFVQRPNWMQIYGLPLLAVKLFDSATKLFPPEEHLMYPLYILYTRIIMRKDYFVLSR